MVGCYHVESLVGCYPDILFAVFRYLQLPVACEFSIFYGVVDGVEFPLAICEVSYTEVGREKPDAVAALETVSQERGFLGIEIFREMGAFQVVAAKDAVGAIAPDKPILLVVDELGDGAVVLVPGVVSRLCEVDELVSIVSADAVGGGKPDESLLVLRDVVHGVARQSVYCGKSGAIQTNVMGSRWHGKPEVAVGHYI